MLRYAEMFYSVHPAKKTNVFLQISGIANSVIFPPNKHFINKSIGINKKKITGVALSV
jgi:hypothetical protein